MFTPLSKNISLPLRVKAAAVPGTDAAIQYIYIYMMEIVKSLEQSGLLEKVVSETNENEEKINKKVDFLICY